VTTLRQQFADQMVTLGTSDPRVVVMVGDISHGILQPYAEACPGRYFNIGICEPSMVNMAAGLNRAGVIPFVHTITPFITERAYEQIKLDFGYQELAVNIVSVGGAFDYSQLGCSHHCYTDVSLFSHLRRAVVMLPSSGPELAAMLKQTYDNGMINYFRLTEYAHGVEFEESEVIVGRGIKVRQGEDVTIATTGAQLRNAVASADALAEVGISAEIIYFHTMKPFDSKLVHESVSRTGRLVTVEELSSHDGLYSQCIRSCVGIGGLVARQLAVDDFIHGYGTYEELCATADLTEASIISAAMSLTNGREDQRGSD